MRLLFPTLLLPVLLQAQPNQILYTAPGALDSQPKASVVSVDANGVTVKHEGSKGLTAITSPGLVYKDGDKWSISKPRIEALPNGAGWAVAGVPMPVRISGGKTAKDLSVGAGGFTLSLPRSYLCWRFGLYVPVRWPRVEIERRARWAGDQRDRDLKTGAEEVLIRL